MSDKPLTLAETAEIAIATIGMFPVYQPQPPRRRRRKPTLGDAIRQAKKEGVNVSAATVTPDGSVSLTFGEAQPKSETDLDKWLAKHNAH